MPILEYTENQSTVHFKWVNYVVCELDLKFVIKIKIILKMHLLSSDQYYFMKCLFMRNTCIFLMYSFPLLLRNQAYSSNWKLPFILMDSVLLPKSFKINTDCASSLWGIRLNFYHFWNSKHCKFRCLCFLVHS